MDNELEWYKDIESIVNYVGLGYILRGNSTNPETVVYKRLVDIFHQKAFADISQESSKLRTYSIFKKEVRMEPYLFNVKNINDRISMTKFRLSNHKLMIEKGTNLNLNKCERKCPFCN